MRPLLIDLLSRPAAIVGTVVAIAGDQITVATPRGRITATGTANVNVGESVRIEHGRASRLTGSAPEVFWV